MTLEEAEINLKKEKEIFIDKIYTNGQPVIYAAIVNHPKKAFEYSIEIGLKQITGERVFLDLLNNGELDIIEGLMISPDTITKIMDNRVSILENKSFITDDNENFGLTDIELDTLKFNSENLNFASLKSLNRLFSDRVVAKQIEDDDITFSDSDELQYLRNGECNCNDDSDCISCKDWNDPHIRKNGWLEGGISIGNDKNSRSAGTLGGIFRMNGNSNNYAITNCHVVEINGCDPNFTDIVHPSRSDDVKKNISFIGELVWKEHNDLVDAAIIKLNNNVRIGDFTRCDEISLSYPVDASFGMKVKKCGKTTGFTEGKVLSTNSTLYISQTNRYYRNQIMTTCKTCPGDSGSLLVNTSNHVLGLLYMNNKKNNRSFANHFKNIFNQSVDNKNCKPKISFKEFINFKNI